MRFFTYLLLLVGLAACSRKVYQRPFTIDRVEIKNTAGPIYSEQFRRVNNFFLHRFDSLQRSSQLLVFDTTRAGKKPNRLNYTLVSSLDTLNLNGRPGVYHHLYFRPNSGKGYLKSGVLQDRYNELKLFSPTESFLRHTELFYSDSLVSGATSFIIPAHELYLPENPAGAPAVSFRVNEVQFYKGLNKQQRNSILRILNNAIVLRQRRQGTTGNTFAFTAGWLPGYNSEAPADFVLDVAVSESIEKNQITLSIEYTGNAELPGWMPKQTSFNRRDFMDGHLYEANSSLQSFVSNYIGRLYYTSTQK